MYKKITGIVLTILSLNAHAVCNVTSILPEDQKAALQENKEVYFRSAHAYYIINNTPSVQSYKLCNYTSLFGKQNFVNEQCTHQIIKPGKSYLMKENLYTYVNFQKKGQIVDVKISSTIEGECSFKHVINNQLKVYG